MYLGDVPLEQVQCFKYLGVILSIVTYHSHNI